MNGIVTFHVYYWGFAVYAILALTAFLAVAWVAYKYGHQRGYLDALEKQEEPLEATKFRQRTADADGRRRATVRTARVMARRQPRPESRREKS